MAACASRGTRTWSTLVYFSSAGDDSAAREGIARGFSEGGSCGAANDHPLDVTENDRSRDFSRAHHQASLRTQTPSGSFVWVKGFRPIGAFIDCSSAIFVRWLWSKEPYCRVDNIPCLEVRVGTSSSVAPGKSTCAGYGPSEQGTVRLKRRLCVGAITVSPHFSHEILPSAADFTPPTEP
ncbi:hypothetical protein DMENIID0001_093830 [Sergentomyia squamirostris]